MRVMGCIVAVIAAFLIFAAPASAKVLCGGLDAQGKLMEPCSAKPAKLIGKVPRTCPKGSFFDLGTWACWKKCPDLYARGVKAVDKGQACERRKKFHYKPASSQQTKGCPSGTAYGIYKGKVGCFACPAGTVLSPFSRGCVAKNMVANPAAPGKTATLRGNPCKAGFLYVKGKCYACAKGYKLDIKDPTGIKACKRELPKFVPTTKVSAIGCPRKDNQFFHVTGGGTCWSCPPFYVRNSFRKIKTEKACASLGIDWRSPKFPEPGMFGLNGADEIVIDIVTHHRDKIDALIKARAAALKSELGISAARDFAAQQWRIIRDTPQASPDLNYMVFMRMIAMSRYNGKKSKADGDLIKSFEFYTKQRRTHIAKDALNMYYAWKAADDYKKARKITHNSTGLTSTLDYGTVPLDFTKIASANMQRQGMSKGAAEGLIAGGISGAAAGTVPVAIGVFKAADMVRTLEKLRGTTISFLKAAKTGLSTVKGFASAAGPLIIVTAATVIAEVAIKNLYKIKNAERDLKAAIRTAGKPVSIAKMAANDQLQSLSLFWGFAASGARSAPKPVLAATAAAYKAKGYK